MMKSWALLVIAVALCACAKRADEKKPAGPPATLITVAEVERGNLEISEETVGTLEAVVDPKLTAEVAGRIIKVYARAGQAVKAGQVLAVIDSTDLALQHRADEAEARRLELLADRQLALVNKGFMSPAAGESIIAQRDVARARAELSRRNLGKAQVRAPTDGNIEVQYIAEGDYVKVGDPLFMLVSNRRLRAHLPFPERVASRVQPGQTVELTSPQAPGKVFAAKITDIRPVVAEGSRAVDAIVDFDAAGLLKAGGTVNASVMIASKPAALLVPEQSVVLRPAGKVVYVIVTEAGKLMAKQRVVETGVKQGGMIEVKSGLTAGETVAADGAGFLAHDTLVAIKEQHVGTTNATPHGAADKPAGQ